MSADLQQLLKDTGIVQSDEANKTQVDFDKEIKSAMRKLTSHQRKFVNEFQKHRNATKAYQLAYPNASYNTANTEGSLTLVKPCIKKVLDLYDEKAIQLAGITKHSIVQEMAKIAFSNIGEYINEDGTLKKDLPEELKSCIKTYKKTKQGITIEFYDKFAALKELAQMTGLKESEVNIQNNMTVWKIGDTIIKM